MDNIYPVICPCSVYKANDVKQNSNRARNAVKIFTLISEYLYIYKDLKTDNTSDISEVNATNYERGILLTILQVQKIEEHNSY